MYTKYWRHIYNNDHQYRAITPSDSFVIDQQTSNLTANARSIIHVFLVPAHMGSPGQSPGNCKMVVVVLTVSLYRESKWTKKRQCSVNYSGAEVNKCQSSFTINRATSPGNQPGKWPWNLHLSGFCLHGSTYTHHTCWTFSILIKTEHIKWAKVTHWRGSAVHPTHRHTHHCHCNATAAECTFHCYTETLHADKQRWCNSRLQITQQHTPADY